MTSEQALDVFKGGLMSLLLSAMLMVGGCATREQPDVLVAPYDTTRGDVLWAVVPPLNESGTSVVDATFIADQVVAFELDFRCK